jgi:hypothetical protein
MTATQSLCGQPAATARSMPAQGLDGVFGATRPVAAARCKHRADGKAVTLDQTDQQAPGQTLDLQSRHPRLRPRLHRRWDPRRYAANNPSASFRKLRLITARLGAGSAPAPGKRLSRTRQVRDVERAATLAAPAPVGRSAVASPRCPPACVRCSAMPLSVPRGVEVENWLPRSSASRVAERHASRTIRLTVLRRTAERTTRLATLIRRSLR